MLDKQQACITEALAPMDGGLDAAPALAQAIGAPKDDLVHHGTLELTGSFPSVDRGFPADLKPDNFADIFPPIVVGGRLKLRNPPRKANDDLRGNNGFALNVEEGISWFQGPVWGIYQWGKVTGSGVDDDGAYYFDIDIIDPLDGSTTGTSTRIWTFGDNPPDLPDGTIVPYTGDTYGRSTYVPLDPAAGRATVTAITDFQATTSTTQCAYDVKTTELTVLAAGVESDWVTHVCNHCP